MNIEIGKIEFGEIDAKNEVFEQERTGSNIFKNSFEIPPKVDPLKITTGARFFIYGQKGCGKTALLLYIKSLLDDAGDKSRTILFKSGITETERQVIAQGQGFVLVEKDDLKTVDYDYKINWLWYIYRNLFRMVDGQMSPKSEKIVSSIKALLGLKGEISTTSLSDLATKSIKAKAKAAINAGPFTAEIEAEIEAVKNNELDRLEVHIIEIIEKYITEILPEDEKGYFLIFDELELFWNRKDQRERDLFLIRDLLYAVSRVNRAVGHSKCRLRVIASVRSEVLNEVNKVGPEVARDVDDFGVRINWNVRVDDNDQPILKIIENKILQSEIYCDQLPSEDVWGSYFPEEVFGRHIKKYLVGVAMFKPRNLVTLLSLVREHKPDSHNIKEDYIEDVQQEFSRRIWREIEEELSTEFSSDEVRAIKTILTGITPSFSIETIEYRVSQASRIDTNVSRVFRSPEFINAMLRALYRAGSIGNRYTVDGDNGYSQKRYGWVFRDTFEPLLDKPFIVHESVRRELQMTFNNRELNDAD